MNATGAMTGGYRPAECFYFSYSLDLTVWLVATFLLCVLVFLVSYVYFSFGCRAFLSMCFPCLEKKRPTVSFIGNPYAREDDTDLPFVIRSRESTV